MAAPAREHQPSTLCLQVLQQQTHPVPSPSPALPPLLSLRHSLSVALSFRHLLNNLHPAGVCLSWT
jgi:hypothetical protein